MAAITVLAALLRLVGIGFLLPHQIEPDGHVIEDEWLLLESGDHPIDRPHPDGLYPQLIPRLATFAPIAPSQATARTLTEHRDQAAHSRRNLRVLIELLSVLIVPATWLLARKFFPGAWSLLPPALIAISVLHIWFTQEIRPHGPAAMWMTFCMLAAMRMSSKPGFWTLVLCGLLAGLSVGCLQSGLAVLPALTIAFLVRCKDAQVRRGHLVLGVAAAGILVAACFVYFYPFLFDAANDGRVTLDSDTVQLSGHQLQLARFNGGGFFKLLRAAWAYEPLMLVLAILGAALCIRRVARPLPVGEQMQDSIVLLAFVVPYAAVIGLYEFSYQRFLFPLLPVAACLVTYALWRAARAIDEKITHRAARRTAVAVLVAIPIALEAFASTRLLQVRAQTDTITSAADWIVAHTRSGVDRILVYPTVDLPVFHTQASMKAEQSLLHGQMNFPWFAYLENVKPQERSGSESEIVHMPISSEADRGHIRSDCSGYFADLRGDYAVVQTGFEGWGRPVFVQLRTELQRNAVLEVTFSPDHEGYWGQQSLGFQEEDLREWIPWTWRVIHARCTGPEIEIYRIPR